MADALPDGSLIASGGAEGGAAAVYVLPADGQGSVERLALPVGVTTEDVTWAPDGRSLPRLRPRFRNESDVHPTIRSRRDQTSRATAEGDVQQDLVERARKGDHDAFAVLAGATSGRLDAAARLILRDPDLAQDAVQETMIRCWRDLPTLRDPDRFEAWLHRIFLNVCRG